MSIAGRIRRELAWAVPFSLDQLAPAAVFVVWLEACEAEPPIELMTIARALVALLAGLIAGALATRGDEIKISLAVGAASVTWSFFSTWRRTGELEIDPASVVILLLLFALGAGLARTLRHRRSRRVIDPLV